MSTTSNPAYVICSAVHHLYAHLPTLLGPTVWAALQPQVDGYLATLAKQPDDRLTASRLYSLFNPYVAARQQLDQIMQVQHIIQTNIAEQFQRLGMDLGIDPSQQEALLAAALTSLDWEVDPNTLPAPEDANASRSITIQQGGLGGGTSVKFTNMKLDLGQFTKLAAGFVTTGFEMIDKPHPLLMAAGVLLTIYALYDTMKVALSEQEASVFWGMSQADKLKPSEAEILTVTNAQREKYGLEPLTELQARRSLTRLAQLKCIEKVGETYRIVENFKVKE